MLEGQELVEVPDPDEEEDEFEEEDEEFELDELETHWYLLRSKTELLGQTTHALSVTS